MENKAYKEEEEDSLLALIDFRKLLSDVVRYWWLFVVAFAIAVVGLKYYHMYTTPVYSATATIIVDNSSRSSYSSNIMEGVMLGQSMRNFDNQLAILGSRTIISKVVDKMGICISYFNKGRIRNVEHYPSSDFVVVMDSTHAQPLNARMLITPSGANSYVLTVEEEALELYNYSTREYIGQMEQIDFSGTFHYGEPVVTPWCSFTLFAEEQINNAKYFIFQDPDRLVRSYMSALSISHDSKSESSVVTLSVSGTNARKNEVFLNTLVQSYIDDNLGQKNLMSENTIRFIEGQLAMLTDTLNRVGTELSSYRSQNGIQNDVSVKGRELIEELKTLDKEASKLLVEQAYYDYLDQYMSNDSLANGDIAPATLDVNRPIIMDQIRKIIELNAQRQVYRDTWGKNTNPMYQAITAELNVARNTLITSIKSHKTLCANNLKDVRAEINSLNAQLFALPETERRLLGIDRKFSLNNDVFTFLMRKRSEAQIQKASNTSDHKLLDAAETTGIVSPNVKRNKTLAYAAALFLPLILLLVRQLLDNKIRTVRDVTKVTNLPIIGEVTNNNKKTSMVVMEYPRSYVSEEFRRIRIKLGFMTKGKEPMVVAVTSSISGDGKTFCSLNIASVFSIAKKKTLLVGFDLRRPGLSKVLKRDKSIGITDYLIGNCTLDDAIINVNGLDILLSGTIPPNPSELLSSQECRDMINELKSRYDVIIIDTPPVGVVSDAFVVANFVDTTIFVVRQDYTLKEAMTYAVEMFNENGISDVCLVMNDINSKSTRYGYGYGYGASRYGKSGKYGKGYGYGYGYGDRGYYAEN